MELQLLRTFVAVAQERHLTRGAERLHISQPTASSHIRALEESCRVELFVRRSGGVELTSAGRTLLCKAQEVLAAAANFESSARTLRDTINGELVIGSNADPVLSRIGRLICAIRERYPLVHLAVEMRPTAAILRGVRNAELDAGFFFGDVADPGLSCVRLRSLTFRVAAPAAWHDAITSADWEALARMPWILGTKGSSYSDMVNSLFDGRGVVVNGVAEANNDLLVRTMIADGVGLSLVRAEHAAEGVRLGTMSVSPIAFATTELVFVYRKARTDEPLVQALLSTVRQTWQDDDAGRLEDLAA